MTGNESRSTLDGWLREAYGEDAGCPPAEAFLDLAEGHLQGHAAERLEAHAAICPACAAELELAQAFASGEPGEGFEAGALEGVVAEVEARLPVAAPLTSPVAAPKVLPFAKPAEPLPGRKARRPGGAWLRWAAAAMLILAAGLAYRSLPSSIPNLPEPQRGGVVRGGEVELLAPLGDLAEVPKDLRWEPYPGASAYGIRLLAVDDAILWEGRSSESRVALPGEALKILHRAVAYRWTVEAFDAQGRSLALSEAGRFRATPAPETP